ncbi:MULTISPECIES: bifunctional biotin--[acetyl-CoA-carboxylase] ligase/biotin operon repressor BirA [unclassified Pseudomonas]|uniref:bifunctional biotin--[acetyl-CoA-carboxylase] ligase/biotin operon repressor BirA n=1 Tax=unclassified Pseudomonas TaxID=196821 RepID=UPI000DAB6876|nr:bifunctional biotin--[acetyl-CoA-carboxylase] ligase/biotin operon repressor BirA [Pseudomonas sp. URMO17WK12:I2]PZW39320.1 BirA family biotin operon repressor/biotin-[acetyl-CoA-carboxylase] ligase [Pseudomonas sp. URMO17WK12:I2]
MQSLLRLLQDGQFHSGEELGAAVGVSRAAIWKRLQALEAEFDLQIHKVRGRGYRLEAPLSLLDSDSLCASSIYPITLLQQVDSTNAQAMRHLASGAVPPFLIIAEQQTAGRGRRGRSWASPFGENLYYSLVLRVSGGMRQLEGLSLVVGLALLQALRDAGVNEAGLKWPNDLLVGGRKIAGILLELSGDPADVCHVVIGIGVNINMRVTRLGEVIDQPWTSLRQVVGEQVDRNAFVASLNRQLERYLHLHQAEGFAALREQWEASHLWQGRAVVLAAGAQAIHGRVLGVDDTGALRLDIDGQEKVFSGGELSLRLHDDS